MGYINGIDHVDLRVPDVDAAVRFYCEGLGLALKRRDDYNGIAVTPDGVILELSPEGSDQGDSSGITHVCYNTWDVEMCIRDRYTPQVAKLQKKDGKLRVTVGYIPTPALTGDYSMSSSTTPTKYMDYVFEKVGKEWYLRALEASEMKADTSAAVSQPEYDLDYDYTDPASIIAGNAGGNSDTQPDGAQEPQDDGNSGEGGEGGSSAPEGDSCLLYTSI